MVMWYWSVAILFWQLSIDHIVNVLCKREGLAKTRLRHPSLPFESLPYPTRTIRRRARTYARSITWQPNEKRLTIFYEYGALKRAREPRYSSTQERWISVNLSIVFRTWAHFLAWLSKFISTVYFCLLVVITIVEDGLLKLSSVLFRYLQ